MITKLPSVFERYQAVDIYELSGGSWETRSIKAACFAPIRGDAGTFKTVIQNCFAKLCKQIEHDPITRFSTYLEEVFNPVQFWNDEFNINYGHDAIEVVWTQSKKDFIKYLSGLTILRALSEYPHQAVRYGMLRDVGVPVNVSFTLSWNIKDTGIEVVGSEHAPFLTRFSTYNIKEWLHIVKNYNHIKTVNNNIQDNSMVHHIFDGPVTFTGFNSFTTNVVNNLFKEGALP